MKRLLHSKMCLRVSYFGSKLIYSFFIKPGPEVKSCRSLVNKPVTSSAIVMASCFIGCLLRDQLAQVILCIISRARL